jgi:hypothetical protein
MKWSIWPKPKYQPPSGFAPQACYGGLSQHQMNQLSTFNSERNRGIMHTPEYSARMAALQRMYDTGIHILYTQSNEPTED